ncbi:MAG: ribonuclease P protein component [Patescibacteria group bacterium]
MFPRRERLRKSQDITYVLRRGRRITSPLFRITLAPRRDQRLQVLVVCGKKVDKRSTVRNKLKRMVRELLRTKHREKLRGYNFVAHLTAEIKDATRADVQRELQKIL